MAITPPGLKTNYDATKETFRAYPAQLDADNAAIIDTFNAVDSALESVFQDAGIQFITDYLRRKLSSNSPNRRVGWDSAQIASPGLTSDGMLILTGDNEAGAIVAYFGTKRAQHIGDLSLDFTSLISSGQIIDEGGGNWSGTVYVGLQEFGDTDLSAIASTVEASVPCPVHRLEVSVASVTSSPVFTVDKYSLYSNGRETLFSEPGRIMEREVGIEYLKTFAADETPREAVIRIPYQHLVKEVFFYVNEPGVTYAGTFQIERTHPGSAQDMLPVPVNFIGSGSGSPTFVSPTLALDQIDTVQPANSFYRIFHGTLIPAPVSWSVGMVVQPVHSGYSG